MTEHFYAVIMAGGGGTRLWPLSRQSRPKQMLQLIDERTLFQIAVQRLSDLFPAERIFVVTNHAQSAELRKQCPQLHENNFLLETEPRGTAAAIGLAAYYLNQRDPDAVMAVLTADHYIGDEQRFLSYLKSAKDIAMQGHLVTLGIEPTYPATQYGYIQQGKAISHAGAAEAFEVDRFKEKPDEAEAKNMLQTGDYSWNSGMFICRAADILKEFEEQMPTLHKALVKIAQAWDSPKRSEVLSQEWPQLQSQTIDYGIMENAQNVAVIPAKDMRWNDVGSWNSLFEVLQPDEDGNVVLSEPHLNMQSRNTLVHINGQQKMVVTIGVEDLIVVDTGDVLLICSKEQAQDVRKIIELLKEKDLRGYL